MAQLGGDEHVKYFATYLLTLLQGYAGYIRSAQDEDGLVDLAADYAGYTEVIFYADEEELQALSGRAQQGISAAGEQRSIGRSAAATGWPSLPIQQETKMDVLREYLALLSPCLLIQLGLMAAGLWDLLHQPDDARAALGVDSHDRLCQHHRPHHLLHDRPRGSEGGSRNNAGLMVEDGSAIRCQNLGKQYGDVIALSRPRSGHSQRCDLRLPRAQRRREDDHDSPADRPRLADDRQRLGGRRGDDKADSSARRVFGYLPQAPTFYGWMTPVEYLDYVARLFAMPAPERRERIAEVLALVGLEDAARRRIRGFSGGMVQRLGHCPGARSIARPFSSSTSRPARSIPPGAMPCSI
jgi:energy-coupling factor transporter ATP-binding protein EcfA2